MKVIKLRKNIVLVMILGLLVFVGTVCFGDKASAATNVTVKPQGTLLCYSWSTGNLTSYHNNTYNASLCGNNGADGVKKIGDTYAYCIHWKLEYNGNTYTEVDSWTNSANLKKAIIAGRIIEVVNGKNYTANEKYIYTGEALNTYFAKDLGESGASNFYSKNATIAKYVDDAKSWYSTNVKLTKTLPTVSITANSGTLKYTSSRYVSEKITISGLVATYGGASDTVTYKVTAKASNGKDVQICTGSNRTGCTTNELSLSGVSGSKNYYLFVNRSDFTAEDTITLSVAGSNKSVYPSSVRYKNAYNTGRQDLITIGSYPVNRTVSKSKTFVIPDLINHRIKALKVDEYGNSLNGATLEIYKDDVSVSSNLLKTNNGSGSSVTYTSSTVEVSKDDFFSHDYYLVEKSAPDGYVLSSSVTHIYRKNTFDSVEDEICYNNGGNETGESQVEKDKERCNFENYQYKCQSSTGELLDLNENETCDFSTPEPAPEEDGQTGSEGTESDGSTAEGEGTTESDGSGEETTPDESENTETVVTYTKICYNVEKNTSADMSYCTDKGNYTKVVKNNNNLEVIQPNKRNTIKISKVAVGGEEEVAGASLKICTSASYENEKEDCVAAKTIDGVEMSWVSGDAAHEFIGIAKGTYYIVEVIPPKGYIKATTATEFSIDEYGDVKTGDKVITNKNFEEGEAIVIENELSVISISKQDMATSKELPGATLSICRTYEDENGDKQLLVDQYTGECIEAVLANGKKATWISTNEPYKIEGLSAGTYYLVEKIAPTDYATAESIQFTLKQDGTLVDQTGKSLADKKLIMYDRPIEEVKTGALNTYMVGGILVLVVGLGIGSYYYLKTSKTLGNVTNKKIRKRRIYKK